MTQTRQLWIVIAAALIVGCVSAGGRIDHSVELINTGKTRIANASYSYGALGLRTTPLLGRGGDGVTKPMPLPHVVEVTWTTAEDGVTHNERVPLGELTSPRAVANRIVSIQIDGSSLRVYVVERKPDFSRDQTLLFSSK